MSKKKDAQLHYLQGCNFGTLLKLLWLNRKDLTIKAAPEIAVIILMSMVLSPIVLIENLLHSRKINKTVIEDDPIFIVGHWRSGTTYLTNIMVNDPQKGYFTVDQTFTHSVFITLERVLKRVYSSILPETRPMDNVKMNLKEPQEEVFALGNQTTDAIIHMLSFPKNARFYAKCAFYDQLNEKRKKRLRNAYLRIIKKVTYYTGGKQLIVKSPDNTCRINMLLELFPDARFIHIYRNPYKVYRSTMGMYRTLFPMFSLEDIDEKTDAEAEEVVLDIYEELFKQYLNDRQFISEGNLMEIKYEDFVLNPMGYVEAIYRELRIAGFDAAKPVMQAYIESQRDYKTNAHQLDEKSKRRINARLAFLFKQYGYLMES